MAGSPKKRARLERMASAVDPLDQAAPRQALTPIPWNKAALTAEGREAVAQALLDGYPRNQIAKALGTSVKTLKRLIDDDPTLGDAIEARKDADEAELRDILMGLARSGDTVAAIFLGKSQYGWRDRDDAKAAPVQSGVGVLVVPGMEDLDTWMAKTKEQQAQFRETPTDVVDQMAEAKEEARQAFLPRTGTHGIEGLRLVKPRKGELTR